MKLTREPRRTATVLSDGIVKVQDVDNIVKSYAEKTLIETAGPATPLAPNQIQASNMQLWILADDNTQADGSEVIATGDMVINSSSVLASGNVMWTTGSILSTIEFNQLNGKKVYRWVSSINGNYQLRLISGTAVDMRFLHDGTSFTILLVGKIRLANPALQYIIFSTNQQSTSFTGSNFWFRDTGADSNALEYRMNNGSANPISLLESNLWVPGDYGFIIVTFENLRSGNDLRIETNQLTNAGVEPVSAFDSGPQFAQFDFGGSGGRYWDGDIATLAIWDKLLTTAELDSLKAWVKNYYAISV